MVPGTVVFILSLVATLNAEEFGVLFQIEENSFPLNAKSIWNGKADSLMSCSQMCTRTVACKSANFMENKEACSLLSNVQTKQAGKLLKQDGSFYLEKVGSAGISNPPGATQSSAVFSCQALQNQYPQASSGVYWIHPDGGSQFDPFRAYCDMETDGGGWTLVWSYTFTNYTQFKRLSNAVTPIPNWPLDPSVVDVPISTTPPLNETDYNAIDFSHWKQLGRQVLIKSNINNWLTCHPGTGSLVDWKDGSITCHIAKHVTDTCNRAWPPARLFLSTPYGPRFRRLGQNYYYFDGSTNKHWPAHDPCGTNEGNHVKNVADPYGSIFIRA